MARIQLKDLTTEQLRELAALAGTTYGSLRQVKDGRRGASSAAAIALEKAAARMGLDLRREDMNAGCAVCEFAKECRKAKIRNGK